MQVNEFRQKKGITFEELAKMFGISVNLAWRLCHGRAPKISLDKIVQIEERTGGEVSYEDIKHMAGGC